MRVLVVMVIVGLSVAVDAETSTNMPISMPSDDSSKSSNVEVEAARTMFEQMLSNYGSILNGLDKELVRNARAELVLCCNDEHTLDQLNAAFEALKTAADAYYLQDELRTFKAGLPADGSADTPEQAERRAKLLQIENERDPVEQRKLLREYKAYNEETITSTKILSARVADIDKLRSEAGANSTKMEPLLKIREYLENAKTENLEHKREAIKNYDSTKIVTLFSQYFSAEGESKQNVAIGSDGDDDDDYDDDDDDYDLLDAIYDFFS